MPTEHDRPSRAPDPNDLPLRAASAAPHGSVLVPQPHEPYGFVAPLVASRVEILSTLVIDAGLTVGAAFVRTAALWMLHRVGDTSALGWPILVLEWILDFGLVGTAGVITLFDLLKRIRVSFRELKG